MGGSGTSPGFSIGRGTGSGPGISGCGGAGISSGRMPGSVAGGSGNCCARPGVNFFKTKPLRYARHRPRSAPLTVLFTHDESGNAGLPVRFPNSICSSERIEFGMDRRSRWKVIANVFVVRVSRPEPHGRDLPRRSGGGPGHPSARSSHSPYGAWSNASRPHPRRANPGAILLVMIFIHIPIKSQHFTRHPRASRLRSSPRMCSRERRD
jgi:hypothetical protein